MTRLWIIIGFSKEVSDVFENWRKSLFEAAICFIHIYNLHILKVEILSNIPGVILYRDLFTEKQILGYLKMLEKLEMSEQVR